MPYNNTFLTPEVIASRAVATLYNNTVLLPLIHRDFDADFNGKVGDTVNVRVPTVFEAQEYDRTTGIQIQDAQEDRFAVRLDKLVDTSFSVTSEDLALNIDDFDEQLLGPAMESIAQKMDRDIANALVAAARQTASADPDDDYPDRQDGGGAVSLGEEELPRRALIRARTKLTRANLMAANRRTAVSPEAAEILLEDPAFVDADKRGDTDGLIEAAIGRKFGFDNYETTQFGEGPGLAGSSHGVAFHRDAVTCATATLPKPMGKSDDQATVKQFRGIGVRMVIGYDMNKKSDVISLDVLYGIRAVRPQGAVELDIVSGS